MLRGLSIFYFCALLPAQDLSGLDALVEARFPATHCPGLSVALAQGNRVVYSKALGWADLEQRVPLRVESVHRLASVSKLVTATIVMDLVESGRLGLDTPVRTYLPELPASYRAVTIRHLLTHQAGVRGYRNDEEVFSTVHYATSRDALKAFASDPLLFEPGTKVEYSTYGFTTLGAAAEAVEGKPFQELSREFFARHGIAGFALDDALALVPGRVRGYFVDAHGSARNARFYDPSNKYPAGGFAASAEDCLRFAIAVGRGRVLKPETLRQMWTAQATARGEKTPFGLGWGVAERHGQMMVGFNGLQPATETALRYFQASGAGVAVFCNAEGAQGFSELLEAITDLLVPPGR